MHEKEIVSVHLTCSFRHLSLRHLCLEGCFQDLAMVNFPMCYTQVSGSFSRHRPSSES